MPFKMTMQTEQKFAEHLRECILYYWRERDYGIEVGIDLPEKRGIPEGRNRRHHVPVFPIRSNLGPSGFPPKRAYT